MNINWGSFLGGVVVTAVGLWVYYNLGPRVGFGFGKGGS